MVGQALGATARIFCKKDLHSVRFIVHKVPTVHAKEPWGKGCPGPAGAAPALGGPGLTGNKAVRIAVGMGGGTV